MSYRHHLARSLGLCFTILANTVLAADTDLTPQFSSCMDQSGGVTVVMLDCIGAETDLQDARLNMMYKEVMGQLSPERKEELKKAQRLWIKYRDANCGFYADPDGGTMATVSASDCVMSMTADRATELEGFKEP